MLFLAQDEAVLLPSSPEPKAARAGGFRALHLPWVLAFTSSQQPPAPSTLPLQLLFPYHPRLHHRFGSIRGIACPVAGGLRSQGPEDSQAHSYLTRALREELPSRPQVPLAEPFSDEPGEFVSI